MDVERYLDDLRERQRRSWPEGIARQVVHPLGEIAVTDHLRHWARERPAHPAIVYYGTEITYAELDEAVDRFAGWLLGVGVRPGDRVGVLLPNCPQFTVAMLGILRAGAVHVPVNPMFQQHELRHELRDAGVEVLVAATELLPLVEQVRADTPLREVLATSPADFVPADPAIPVPPALHRAPPGEQWSRVSASPRAPHRDADLDALAALNYTGGTTGMPKGCEHTQRHMLYTAVTARAARPPRRDDGPDVYLGYVPVFWIAGEDFGILVPIVHGATVVLLNRWDATAVLRAVERYRVTDVVGTVDNYVELMEHPEFATRNLSSVDNPRSMSFVRKLTPQLRRRWSDRVGAHSVLREASYGMTETHTADTFTYGFADDDRDLRSEPVFCGLPVPGTEFAVVDPEDGAPLPLGERGAIAIRTPSLLTGYWRRPDADAEVLRDGWLRTGDIGLVDEDGCLHYLGRDKEMIKVNGMSVFPSEVEALLARHPDVLGAAVVPVPDPATGQRPLAFVVPVPGAEPDAAALRGWAESNMARYKVPRFEIVAELPMTATGKVKKGDLLDRARRLVEEDA
ncbi:AMP-binding protein [Saccharopolyspora sp. CA-218241]|uniref:AMP-binding protein n=1 Tax=Saccharopolyspora sp. CA-218241 TaxID=3240027 RepID=UPI003D951C6B